MEKELLNNEKQLLLTDLCARLPHGVKIRIEYPFLKEEEWHSEILYGLDLQRLCIANTSIRLEEFKPYLFPLSSMTEEQKEELITITNGKFRYMWDDITNAIPRKNTGEWGVSENAFIDGINVINILYIWLLKNHFDINGLIPMGLAIDCTNLNIY